MGADGFERKRPGTLASQARTAIVLVFISWLLALAQPVCAAAPPALHLTQAELWHSPSGSWAPPDTLTHSDDAVLEAATPWQTVALPHARPRAVATPAKAAQAPPQVAWYRLQVPAAALAASPQGPRVYIPRWQTSGTVAVYANDRLLWQTRGSRTWNSTNRPVWIDLGGATPADTTLTLHVRMASQRGVGGALSTLWVGPAEALLASWRARTLLQADGVAFSRGSYLVIGLFALLLWLARRRRGEGLYLLFFVMSVFQVLSMLHYMVDSEGFGLPDEWFAWLAYVAGSMGSALCSFLFLCVINQLRLPRLKAAMLLYVGAACLITLPPLGLLELNTALPALRLALIPPGLVMIGVGVWGAIQRRTWGSALLALWLLLSLPIGFTTWGCKATAATSSRSTSRPTSTWGCSPCSC